MPYRNLVFATNEIYHIYNHSVGNEDIGSSKIHLRRMLELISYYRYPQKISLARYKNLPERLKKEYDTYVLTLSPLVEIYAYAFMSNHYHILLKQLQDKGIAKFVANAQNSFAKHFNGQMHRKGALFINPFQAKLIDTDELFAHVSRYIHLNPVTAYLIPFNRLATFPYASFPIYANSQSNSIITVEPLLAIFGSREKYVKFVADQVDYQRTLAAIKHVLID